MKLVTLDEIDRWNRDNENKEAAYVKPATEYASDVIDYLYGPKQHRGAALPWGKCLGQFDLRPAEVTLWLGINGHGKSLMLGQIMQAMMQQGQKVLIASLEMRPVATLARMVRQASGGARPAPDYINRWHQWTDDRLWLYDQHGTINPKRATDLVRYATRALNVQHVVIDSLMKVVGAEDAYNDQKLFVDALCIEARDTGAHIHLIHHSRKLGDERNPPGKMDAKGSGAISDLVDNVATVWRRKEPDPAMPDALLCVDKQRHGEWEGKIGLWFHAPSQQYVAEANQGPMTLCHV